MPASADGTGLAVDELRVEAGGGVDIVSEVSFAVPPGAALGIVGESGCGKTTVAMALLAYARPGTRIARGAVRVEGTDVLALDQTALRSARGRMISFVPQNPSKSLSPGMRVAQQLDEMLEVHRAGAPRGPLFRSAWEAAQLPAGDEFLERYPHQLSGGQQQRVSIAMALVCEPAVIVMDEPTTGLDVITQARLLEVIRELRTVRDAIIVYVSHDLAVVRNLVDRVAVMYGGRIVEEAAVEDLFREPRHPYTRRLLEAIPRLHRRSTRLRGIPGSAVEPWDRPAGCPFAPRCDFRVERCDVEMPPVEATAGANSVRCWRWRDLAPPALRVVDGDLEAAAAPTSQRLLRVRELRAGYRDRRRVPWQPHTWTEAVRYVSFEVERGACTAIVGESGSGKTTLGRCLAGLHAPLSGVIEFDGEELAPLAKRRPVPLRRRIQIVFQDPDSSLNPTMSVAGLVRRPLRQFFELSRRQERVRVTELLERVRLPAAIASRLPGELSGGEKQRVALARALAAEPDLLICDEVTSALDVAVQANILELLADLRRSLGMAMIFISHDLAVVRTISDDVIVMREGEIREASPGEALFAAPHDVYTRQLLSAIPDLRDDDYPQVSAAASIPR